MIKGLTKSLSNMILDSSNIEQLTDHMVTVKDREVRQYYDSKKFVVIKDKVIEIEHIDGLNNAVIEARRLNESEENGS